MSKSFYSKLRPTGRWRGMGRTTRRVDSIAKEVIGRSQETKYIDRWGYQLISSSDTTPFLSIEPAPTQGTDEYSIIGDRVHVKSVTVKYNYWISVNIASSPDAFIPVNYITGHLRLIVARAKFQDPYNKYTFEQLFVNVPQTNRGRLVAFPRTNMIEVLKDETMFITAINSNVNPAIGPDPTVRYDNNPLACAPCGGTSKYYAKIDKQWNLSQNNYQDTSCKLFLAVVFCPTLPTSSFTTYTTNINYGVRYGVQEI